MKLDRVFFTSNIYSGSNWNRENTEKYIFSDEHGKYELGFFEHYMDDNYVKSVIEMPISYGCPAKCKYCASSNISCFHPMDEKQLNSIFKYIYLKKDLKSKTCVLLSITGIGDIRFNTNNVIIFLNSLKQYKNIYLTISSNFWNKGLLKSIVDISSFVSIRYIQYTYISSDDRIVRSIIPLFQGMNIQPMKQFVGFIEESKYHYFRINYIVIKGINDSNDSVSDFINRINGIKKRIIVRISKLNETNATVRNNLESTDINTLYNIENKLKKAGVKCYVFFSKENDHMNCGQLLTES